MPWPGAVADVVARAGSPDYARWAAQVRRVGGCSRPVQLGGGISAIDTGTGELHEYRTASEAAGALLVPCGSRHASRCRSCAATYRADMVQLLRAGLLGGKGRSESVRAHPRVFVTLTAPGFGPVHTCRADRTGRALACRPRRGGEVCGHGENLSCGRVHDEDDPVLGMPLCPGCFDYPGAVLWNAHAGALWHLFTVYVPVELAKACGVTVATVREEVRLSYAKVAEFQRRGLVHFHAVIRLDDHDDPDGAPRPVYDVAALETAVRAAVRRVRVETAVSDAVGAYRFGFGRQVDVQPIPGDGGGGPGAERKVVHYLVKYATKSVDTTGGGAAVELAALDRRIGGPAEIRALPVPMHYRAMIGTAWRLASVPELDRLRLRRAAHQLGYRGPVMSRSKVYSTTLTKLRGARAAYRAEQARRAGRDRFTGSTTDRDGMLIEARWEYLRTGYRTAGDAMLARGIRDQIHANRLAAREAREHDGDPPRD